MDHLLETATQLLPHVYPPANAAQPKKAAQRKKSQPALERLETDLAKAIAAAYKRRDDREAASGSAPVALSSGSKTPEPPESARAAPAVLAVEVLADVLAREPSRIPAALAEAGEARFYPAFLDYLVDSILEMVGRRRLTFWKRIAAREHINLMDDRRQRVAEIVLETDSWARTPAASAFTPEEPPAPGSARPGSAGVTASILGAGQMRAQAEQVKEHYRRAASYVRDKAGWSHAQWKPVCDLLAGDTLEAQNFIVALKAELLVKPDLVRRLSDVTAVAVPFAMAFERELREIERSRARREDVPAPRSAPRHSARLAADMDLLGIALSGGGVRSATFNLGVLQALAHFGLLKRLDYLSTVSGGGYIGAWLMSWSKRVRGGRPTRGVADVEERLRTEPLSEPDALSVRAVRFLREYSNYLTPQSGVFTADTWTMLAIWLRNTMLNQAVLVLTLCGMLGLPWMLWYIQSQLAFTTSRVTPGQLRVCGEGLFATSPVMMWAAAALLLYASAITGHQLRRFGVSVVNRRRMVRETLSQGAVLFIIVAPVLLSAALISTALYNTLGCEPTDAAARVARRDLALLFAAGMVVVAVGGRYSRCFLADRVTKTPTMFVRASATLWAAAIIGGAIAAASVGAAAGLVAITRMAAGMADPPRLSFAFVAFGPPAVIAVFSLMIVVKIGLLGRDLFDEHREWWSRLGAWLNIVSLAWLIVCSLSLYSPKLVLLVGELADRFIVASGGVLWAAWTAAGVILGRRETNANMGASTTNPRIRGWIVTAAPYAFIVGLLIILSVATFEVVSDVSRNSLLPKDLEGPHNWGGTRWHWAFWLPPGLLLAAFVLSWRVDVNEFSMHHFYKNRLVRCYLGASRDQRARRPERTPDPFTGFDAGDDLKVAYMREKPGADDPGTQSAKSRDNPQDTVPYIGPLPIINTALNLVKGDDLAWQERKAQSFVFTPFYSGYDYRHRGNPDRRYAPYGFRPTDLYGYPPFGVGLGTAMAISGAAASPNMGHHSSPPATFLMTMFNARLGWWMGNPRDKHNWLRSGPRRGLLYLLNELFGLTNDRTHFVNLSDGGHFENLGIYELIHRRCRYIIACDAEQDAAMTFNGLGNAIRKCRTDLGAEISVSATRIRPVGAGTESPLHCVLGDITYADGEKGTLLYLKASVTGDEPADVLEYAARERAFPHHATLTDQFFDESQFESYRKLGFHVAHTAFATPMGSAHKEASLHTDRGLAALFDHMRDYWHPASPALDERRSAHAAQYQALLDRLMREPTLSFADGAFFNPPAVDIQDRPRMFVGALMLDLMQRVYIDLDLDNDRSHPHNAGWITIFERWKLHPAVIEAWNASKSDYRLRFRWFFDTL